MSGKKWVLTQTSNFSGREGEKEGGRVFGGGEMRRRRLGGEMGGADGVCGGPAAGDAARGNAGIDQVMLRFRPIAPKPATEGPCQGASHVGSKGWPLSGARTKRKYVRVRKPKGNSYCSSNNNSSSSSSNSTKRKRAVVQGPKGKGGGPDGSLGLEKQIVTLQLLPEKADHGESKALKAKPEPPEQEPRWCTTNSWGAHFGPEFSTVNLALPNRVPPMWPSSDPIHRTRYPRVLECWVVVESVADARIDAQDPQLVGLTGAERMRNLETDACPGFLADPSDRVKWVNGAFARMVMREHLNVGTDSGPMPAEIAVKVVAKEELPKTRAAFACRVTVRQREDKWAATIVPCDVWRVDEVGGFAWRLDVKAALSLGLT